MKSGTHNQHFHSLKGTTIGSVIGGIVAGISVVGGAVLWLRHKRYKERMKRLQRTARPSTLMAENLDAVYIPFQGKSAARPVLPQAKRGLNSISTPGALPKDIIPSGIPQYSNSEDVGSSALPSGYGAIDASVTASSFVSTRTTVVAPTAPDATEDDLRTSRNGIPGMASQMHNPISPPSGFHLPAVVIGVPETSLDEPVEEGLMTMQASTPRSSSTMPPPYSHG